MVKQDMPAADKKETMVDIVNRRLREEEEALGRLSPEDAAKIKEMRAAGAKAQGYLPKATADIRIKDVESAAVADQPLRITTADVAKPYYGDKFEEELLRGMRENEKLKVMPTENYQRYFDEVPVGFAQKPPYYNVTKGEVSLSNAKGREIMESNADTMEQWYKDDTDPKYQKKAGEALRVNNYSNFKDYKGKAVQSLEHEVTHHALRPYDKPPKGSSAEGLEDAAMYTATDENHLASESELLVAMSALQREHYKATGKRIEKPEEFKALLDKENPEYLSGEGKRLLNYTRKLKEDYVPKEGEENPRDKKFIRKQRDKAIEAVSRALPAVVKNEFPQRKFFSA